MQGIFQKENTDKALKYGIYRHLPTYEKIIRNLVSFYIKKGKVCVNGVTEELFLERLAKRVSLSPFYFSRRFKQETGYTPYHYIYTSRIHLARFYLKTSEDTVKEIGYRCGFKSEHSFCTALKNEMGQTPTEFREG